MKEGEKLKKKVNLTDISGQGRGPDQYNVNPWLILILTKTGLMPKWQLKAKIFNFENVIIDKVIKICCMCLTLFVDY